MTEKRFEIDDDGDYLIDNKTGNLYDACGGGDGFPFVINEYHKLEKENKQLKEELKFWKNQAKQCPMMSSDAWCEKNNKQDGFDLFECNDFKEYD